MRDLLANTEKEPTLEDLCVLNHTVAHGFSFLAVRFMGREVAQRVCKSDAGFYIGAVDNETWEPLARDSEEYWATKEEADHALKNRTWSQRLHP